MDVQSPLAEAESRLAADRPGADEQREDVDLPDRAELAGKSPCRVMAAPQAAVDTAVRAEKLVALNEQLLQWQSTFKLHPTMKRTLQRRREALN